MTGPNPDADLDAALGITALPPAAVTDTHRRVAAQAIADELATGQDAVAQAIADAGQRGAARVLVEHAAAGTADTTVDVTNPRAGEQAWTFFGHWASNSIVIEHAVSGVHDNVWPDAGDHEEGLWAASGTGTTIEAAAAVVAEYRNPDNDPGGPLDTTGPEPIEAPCPHPARRMRADGRLVCPDCADVAVLSPAAERLLRQFHEHAEVHQGRLAVTGRPTRRDGYVVGYEFGRGAPDSPMAGGAAYGVGDDLEAALRAASQGVGMADQ